MRRSAIARRRSRVTLPRRLTNSFLGTAYTTSHLSGGGGGLDPVPGLIHSPIGFGQMAARPWINIGDPVRGGGGFPLNNLTQVQPQRAPEQFTLIEGRAPRAFREQPAELLVQPDRERHRLHTATVARCTTEASSFPHDRADFSTYRKNGRQPVPCVFPD